MKYIKPLDGLRAAAVFLVIISHWLSDYTIINNFPFGEIGVDIFFVLSGFLISSILLQSRQNYYQNNLTSRLKLIKLFIIRRTLRIFPIYYLTIISLYFVANKTGTNIKHDFVYYLTYTSNINFYLKNSWDGIISPLWSLAVEEQFYLIWPWIILYTSKKYLLPVIIGTIVIGISSNFVFNDFGFILTPTCFDAFGIGALIAYERVYKKDILGKYLLPFFLFSLTMIVITYFTYHARVIPLRTVVACTTGCLIIFLLKRKSLVQDFLSTSVLVFIGKISYGIYLYHMIISWLWENVLRKLGLHFNKGMLVIQEFIILILVAWLSWNLVEKRINNLKKRFSYNLGTQKKRVLSNLENKREIPAS
jgi:peptidoglycan/LPS O-acetylase OafA/YrhL